jgi:hypothetical protein
MSNAPQNSSRSVSAFQGPAFGSSRLTARPLVHGLLIACLPAIFALLFVQTSVAGAHATTRSAPVVRLAGTKLHWQAVGHARRYTVETIAKSSHHVKTSRRVVTGTKFAPAAAAGKTIEYRVAARVSHARMSPAVTITWPRIEAHVASAHPSHRKHKTAPTAPVSTPTTPAAPAPTTTPTAPTAPTTGARTTKLDVGVMNTTGWGVDSIFTQAGVKWTRLDVGDGSDLTLVQKAISDGITPLVLYNPGPGLDNVSPATAAAQVKSLAQRLAPMGINEIEFGNEVYSDETAQTYAAQYAAAHAAIAGMGFKLLAVATAIQAGQDGDGNPQWIPNFIAALPGGASEVDAWTIHPYGPMTGYINNSWGWQSVVDWHNIAVAAGSTAPWYITEVGQAIGGTDNNVTEAQQAADMPIYLNQAESYPWVAYIDFYTCQDDPTGQFGLLNPNNTPRPAFTALQNWITQNTNLVNG